MPTLNTNGIEIFYEIHGTGQPLVLISGLGYPAWEWHRMVPYLAQHFQVITFDNRGVGKSSKPTGPYSAALLAADTIGVLDQLGIQQATIVGHSMGGFIAQELALAYPRRVTKLIICSTNFGGPHHIPITAEAWTVLSDITSDPVVRFKNGLVVSTAPAFVENNPGIIQNWLEWRIQNPVDIVGYQAQMGIGLGLLAESAAFENKLPALTVPTLIVFGAHDKVVPAANANLLAKQIPNSEIAILPSAGHFFPIETPEEAAHIFSDFILKEANR